MSILQIKTQLLLLLFALFIQSSLAQAVVDVSEDHDAAIGKSISHFHDASKQLKFKDVVDNVFHKLDDDVPNFGYNTGADWLKIVLTNSSTKEIERIIRINKPIIDTIQLYSIENGILKENIVGSLVNTNPSYEHCKSNYFHITLSTEDTVIWK